MADDVDAERPQRSPGWPRAVADVISVLRVPVETPVRITSIGDFTTAAVFHGVEGPLAAGWALDTSVWTGPCTPSALDRCASGPIWSRFTAR
jgi:hypothetical protein